MNNRHSHKIQYLIHPPRRTVVFTTDNPLIADVLRKRHNWLGRVTEGSTLPSCISTSCIRELDDGNVLIDHEAANGELLAADIRALLIRKGFVQPDLRFVGRMIRSVHKRQVVPPKCTDIAAGDEEVDIWSDDGLDEAKEEIAIREKDNADVDIREKDGLDEPITAESDAERPQGPRETIR